MEPISSNYCYVVYKHGALLLRDALLLEKFFTAEEHAVDEGFFTAEEHATDEGCSTAKGYAAD